MMTENQGKPDIYNSLDQPNQAGEAVAALYRELRNDPAAFLKDLKEAQAHSLHDNNRLNDLKIVYGPGGTVSSVEIEGTLKNRKIFDRESTDKYLAVEDFQRVDPAKAGVTIEPLLKNDGDKEHSLFHAIDTAEGTSGDGSLTRRKVESFILACDTREGAGGKAPDDNKVVYTAQNKEAAQKLLASWGSDDLRHLRGMVNVNAGTIFTPKYAENDSLTLNRLAQVLDKPKDELFSGQPEVKAAQLDQAIQNNQEEAQEKSPDEKLADFFKEPHTLKERAALDAEMFEKSRAGAEYLVKHPEVMAQLTKEVPLVQGSNYTSTYFDMSKINSFLPDSVEEIAITAGLKASNVYLQQYGKEHSYDPTAPRGLDSLPVDSLVKMLYYFKDPSIKSTADLRASLTLHQ